MIFSLWRAVSAGGGANEWCSQLQLMHRIFNCFHTFFEWPINIPSSNPASSCRTCQHSLTLPWSLPVLTCKGECIHLLFVRPLTWYFVDDTVCLQYRVIQSLKKQYNSSAASLLYIRLCQHSLQYSTARFTPSAAGATTITIIIITLWYKQTQHLPVAIVTTHFSGHFSIAETQMCLQ